MIWTILLIIAALGVLFICIIVFMPFGVSILFSNGNEKNRMNAFFFLFYSFFLRVEYDFAKNDMIIRLFGRKLDFSKKDNSPKEQRDDTIRKDKKDKKDKTLKDVVKAEKKTEITVVDEKDKKIDSDVATSIAPSVAIEVHKADSNQQDIPDHSQHQSPSIESADKVPVPEQLPQAKQKEKKERFTQMIERIRSSINQHPAVFFIKQEKLRNRGWRWIVRILKSILRIIAIRRLLVRTELVFDDPALGGKLFGYYECVRHAASLYSKKINLYFRPLFMKGDTSIAVDFCATTSLWKIGYPLLVAVVTFPYLTFGITWWRFYRLNRRQKKTDEKRT